jgi:uncharacterized protein
MLTYADPSAIVGSLLGDSVDPHGVRSMVLDGADPVLVSEVAVVEVASACMAAERGSRISDGRAVIAKFESWCAPGGRMKLLALRPAPVLELAARLTREHRLYALDAIHLAVALEDVIPLAQGEPVRFLTCDRIQADAARALGFTVA